MAVSPNTWPTITSFKAVGGIGSITFTVEATDPHQPFGLPYLKTLGYEFYAADTDSFTAASKIAEGATGGKVEGLTAGSAKYCWFRPYREARAGGQVIRTLGPVYPGSGGGSDDPGTPGSGVFATVFSDGGAWVSYTPVVSAASGTIASYTAVGRYQIRGKSCVAIAAVQVTDNGTGAGALRVTLPFAASAVGGALALGRKSSTGEACIGVIAGGNDYLELQKYDATYPVASGQSVTAQAEYQLP